MKYFCPLAFRGLMVDTDGTFRPCCYSPEQLRDQSGNKLRNISINEAFYSDDYNNLRNELKENKVPRFCNGCFDMEVEGSISSPRQKTLEAFDESRIDELVSDPKLEYLDYRESNLCNLGCLSCSSGNSSFIENEEKEINRIFPQFETWEVKTTRVPFNFEEFPNLKELYFAGGEPTIMKGNIRLISDKRLHEKLEEVSFNTNLAALNKEFYEHLAHFKKVKIFVSLDAVGEALEYLRYPIKWQKVKGHIEFILKNYLNCQVAVFCVLQGANLFNLKDLLIELDRLQKLRKISINFINYLVNEIPHPSDLGEEVIENVIKEIEELKIEKNLKESALSNLNLALLKSKVEAPQKVRLSRYLLKTYYKDAQRGTSLKDSLPQFYERAKIILNSPSS